MAVSPKVSVILTSYNHGKYLREAIESVLGQTYKDFELIIWDDGSTDKSWQIINSYTFTRIQAFRSKTTNVIQNIRTAISEVATGEYIAVHHSDDVWEPEKLEKQAAFLDSNPHIGAVFTWASIIDEDGQPFQDQNHFYYKIFQQPNRTRHEWLNYFFYHGNALCHPSVLIRRQCYQDVGLYRYGMAQIPDFDMWVRLCLKHEIHVLPEKLVRFRVREGEANASGNRPEVQVRAQFEFLQVYSNYLTIADRHEFLKIFPDAGRFLEGEDFDIPFALAMTALSAPYNFGKLFGLQLLFDAINEPERAQKIERVYGFRHQDLIDLTAKNDIFSLTTLQELNRQVTERDAHVQALTSQLAEWDTQVQALTVQLHEILSSKAWWVAMMLRRIRVFLFPPGGIIPGLKRALLLYRNALNFYRKNGIGRTLFEIQNRLRLGTRKTYSYQYLVEKFPQRFGTLQGLSRYTGEWKAIVDASAQVALQKLLTQFSIMADAKNVLPLVKDIFEQDRYLHVLDNIFMLEQFITEPDGSKVYPLVQTSSLPEVSTRRGRRRILFITAQFPNPHNGGGNRVRNFIKILSENNDVYLSSCFIPEDDAEALAALTPYCRSIQKIPLWRFGSNQTEIRDWLKGVSMDVVHYEWPRSLENYDPVYGKCHIFTYMEAASLRLLMDMVNLEVLSDPWVTKLIELVHTSRLELMEASRLNARIAVTTKDGEFFRGLYPYQEYAVLNHGITFDEFSLPDVEPEPHTLVFVGNYQHYPNVTAMEYFFREIWNDIIREVPDTRIYIVGPKPPKAIECHADGKQIFVTGGVADIRPYIQKASVCVAPLITGAGMRGKVIDYAALRRVFVATSIATTDLIFRDDVDYMRADTAQEFAQKTVTLLRDENRAKQMANAAYETARQNYDNRRLSDFLLRLYEYLEN